METDSNQDQKSNEKGFLLLSRSVGQLAITLLLLITVLIVFFALNSSTKKDVIESIEIMEEHSNLSEDQLIAYDHGKDLFKANCASCHAIGRKLIGPDLANITDKREKEWLYKWIRNNNELRKSGDEDAIAIYEEYNRAPMNLYLQFTNEDVDAILFYVDEKVKL